MFIAGRKGFCRSMAYRHPSVACPISPCSEQASPPVKPTISGMECTRQCGEGQRKASHYHFSCLHNITHKATYLWLHFVHILCTQSHLLSCHVVTQKAAYCHLTFSKTFTHKPFTITSLFLHANTHKGSYCDWFLYVNTQKANYCCCFNFSITHKATYHHFIFSVFLTQHRPQ